MWIYLNNAFLSIVDPAGMYGGGGGRGGAPATGPLLVRARFKGDIERVFPGRGVKVEETSDRDYRFRALIARDSVRLAISMQIEGIDYSNFKGSTSEKWRHDAYLGCWSVMEREQRRQNGPREPDRRLLDDFLPDAMPRPAGARRKR